MSKTVVEKVTEAKRAADSASEAGVDVAAAVSPERADRGAGPCR